MSRNVRWSASAHAGPGLALAVCVCVSACSADVTRFDFPAFNLADSDAPTGALPPGPRPGQGFDLAPAATPIGVGANEPGPGAWGTSRPGSIQRERLASLGEDGRQAPAMVPEHRAAPAAEAAAASERGRQLAAPEFGAERRAPNPPREPKAGAAAAADTITVEAGDSLYAIAQRYRVSLADLIDANGLHHGVSLKPGQQLLLPAGAVARQARRAARSQPQVTVVPVAATPVTAAGISAGHAPAVAAAAPTTGAAPPAWQGRYTIKAGESLYGIARQHKVTLAELKSVNDITNPLQVKAGTTLIVPATAEAPVAEAPAARGQVAPQEAPATARIINAPAEKKLVSLRSDQMSDADPLSPAAAAPITAEEPSTGRFRWPVRGRVIAGFGRRPDGTHNDGINLAVPQGTDVHASEGGKVAYAGNELKGYGNLILIRHDNGYVSAYAHNEQLLVKRDDVVRRGQVIAKAGKTGAVDQPQLHFELRQGSKPVDPMPHLEKN